MFDSPFEFCAICGEYVLLDQTQRECAREHACAPATRCPLHRFFTGIEFGKGNNAADNAARGKRPRAAAR